MEDAASVDVFGIAPDHIAKLPTIDIELPKQPPAKVAQTNQPVVEPSVGAASQTIAPEPITQPATPELRQAVASPPPKQLPVGPPPLTRDELETLIQLSRSLEPDLAFSRQSLAFAMGQSPDAAERLMRRWLQHGVVIPAGRAHDIEVFVVPDAIRRDIADLVMQQPELSRPPLIDFGQMPAQLSALSPISPPYQGTKLAAQFDVAPTPSISAWSADIISKAYKLGSLEATRQILRAHQKLLVVDLLPTVVALEHRTVYWRRVFIIAVTALILAGILTGLFVALTRATDWGLFLAVILALGLLATMVIWAINHQIARAWLRLWGEMGLK